MKFPAKVIFVVEMIGAVAPLVTGSSDVVVVVAAAVAAVAALAIVVEAATAVGTQRKHQTLVSDHETVAAIQTVIVAAGGTCTADYDDVEAF